MPKETRPAGGNSWPVPLSGPRRPSAVSCRECRWHLRGALRRSPHRVQHPPVPGCGRIRVSSFLRLNHVTSCDSLPAHLPTDSGAASTGSSCECRCYARGVHASLRDPAFWNPVILFFSFLFCPEGPPDCAHGRCGTFRSHQKRVPAPFSPGEHSFPARLPPLRAFPPPPGCAAHCPCGWACVPLVTQMVRKTRQFWNCWFWEIVFLDFCALLFEF